MKRCKRRYLALKLESEGLPTEKELMDSVWDAVTRLYGEVGASLTSLALINFDIEHKIVVIRTSLSTLNQLRSSLSSITSVAGKEATLHVLAVSGTIKALLKNIK